MTQDDLYRAALVVHAMANVFGCVRDVPIGGYRTGGVVAAADAVVVGERSCELPGQGTLL